MNYVQYEDLQKLKQTKIAQDLLKNINDLQMEENFQDWIPGIKDGSISPELSYEYMSYLLDKRMKQSTYEFKQSLNSELTNGGLYLGFNLAEELRRT